MERYKEEAARLFSDVHGNRMKSNKHRLAHGKFWLNIVNKIFDHCEDGQTLEQDASGSFGILIHGDAQN